MSRVQQWLAMLAMLAVLAVLLAACSTPAPSASSRATGASASASASVSGSSASPSAAAKVAPPSPPASEILSKRPELLLPIDSALLARLDGAVTGDDQAACPELKSVRGADEFERHEAAERARAACEPWKARAKAAAQRCPLLLRAEARLGQYDFSESTLPVEFVPDRNYYTSARSFMWWSRIILLYWPGVLPVRVSRRMDPDIVCIGGWIDNRTGFSNTVIDVPMPPGEAKAFKAEAEAMGALYVEVAAVLTGKAAREPLACDAVTPNSAVAQVLAWRLVLESRSSADTKVLPWRSEMSSWADAPESCEEERKALGLAPTVPAPSAEPAPEGVAGASGSSAPTRPAAPKPPADCVTKCGDECAKTAPSGAEFPRCMGFCQSRCPSE